jgi:hypothetical protein
MAGFIPLGEQIVEEEGPAVEEAAVTAGEAIATEAEALAQKAGTAVESATAEVKAAAQEVEAEGKAILDAVKQDFSPDEVGQVEAQCPLQNAAIEQNATNAERVTDKLSRYLLNPDHPVGGTKAKWFDQALGFNRANLDDLAAQIKFDPSTAVQTGVTQYGTQFNQIINIVGSNGRTIPVTFGWIVPTGQTAANLVTAIPTPK